MTTQPLILVLCTGNSCRSQIAAAYLEALAGDRFAVRSAGTEPAATVHPLAIRVLAEDGIDIGDATPTDYRELLGRAPVRILITVCDGAARVCPTTWPGAAERLHWPFEDPAACAGSEVEILAKFRQVRDLIKARVQDWVGESRADPH